MPGIAFERVSKVFPDGTAAVTDLDLRVHDGEFCVVLGPSGCGKSTALRLVAGLEEVTQGTIRIGDEVVNHVAAQDRGIAMVFETSALYPHLSVADNMALPLRFEGEREAQRSHRVQRAASRLGIGRLLGRRPQQLSAGQRQVGALGRATVRRPQAFLMDEPLSDLDAKLHAQMRRVIARLHRDLGTTVLYVTHDQSDAMALGDRVAVMRGGRLEQVAEPRTLYDRPVSLFVASFVGSPPMNLWHVRLLEDDGRMFLAGGDQRLRVPPAVLELRTGLRRRVGRHLILGLRAEALGTAGGRTRSRLTLPVAFVEALGSHQLVHLEAQGAGMRLEDVSDTVRTDGRDDARHVGRAIFTRPTATLTARLPPHPVVKPGEVLELFVDLERAHFFDPATQRALD